MTTIDKIMALADEYADAYGAWKETRGERREALRAALVADEARHHVPAPPEMQAAVDAALAQPDVPEGYVLVPVEPTPEMRAGLARDIIMWLQTTSAPRYGSKLHSFLRAFGQNIPDWLAKEIPDTNLTPTKQAIATCIYKAMLAASPKGGA